MKILCKYTNFLSLSGYSPSPKRFRTTFYLPKTIKLESQFPNFILNLVISFPNFMPNLVISQILTTFALVKIIIDNALINMIQRLITPQLNHYFANGKVMVVIGARQVGKTTLIQNLASESQKVLMLNCDNYDERAEVENKTSTELRALLNGYDIALIDEAQRVANIGLTIKLIADMKLNTKVVVTGSSSLDLADGISEAATGRHIDFMLYPLSVEELVNHTSLRDERRMLSTRLIYGMYPEIVTNPGDARRMLTMLANDYLFKDVLSYKGIKKPAVLQKLLRALALQVGSEVSYNELAGLLGIDKATVENYITLLEKCFVVFTLESFSRNMRNEIKKGKKIYFYDNGIRNAIINNFAIPELRNDMGALWENFVISERMKRNAYSDAYAHLYFWRTHAQQEIDLIEERDGQINTFEFKYNGKVTAKMPTTFASAYPGSTFSVVTPDNYMDFVCSGK